MGLLTSVSEIGIVEILGIVVAIVASRFVYYAFLHPLSIYHGPPLAAQTYLWCVAAPSHQFITPDLFELLRLSLNNRLAS